MKLAIWMRLLRALDHLDEFLINLDAVGAERKAVARLRARQAVALQQLVGPRLARRQRRRCGSAGAELRFQHQGVVELAPAKDEIGRDAEPRNEQDRQQPGRHAGGGAALAQHARHDEQRHRDARDHRQMRTDNRIEHGMRQTTERVEHRRARGRRIGSRAG